MKPCLNKASVGKSVYSAACHRGGPGSIPGHSM